MSARALVFAGALLFAASPALACPMADAAAYTEAAAKVDAAEGSKATFDVAGMSCGSCSSKVTDALGALDGVHAAAVDYQTGVARVAFDPAKITEDKILETIKNTGYEASKHTS